MTYVIGNEETVGSVVWVLDGGDERLPARRGPVLEADGLRVVGSCKRTSDVRHTKKTGLIVNTKIHTFRRRIGDVGSAGEAVLAGGIGRRDSELGTELIDGRPVVFEVRAISCVENLSRDKLTAHAPPNRFTPLGVWFQCMYSLAQAW